MKKQQLAIEYFEEVSGLLSIEEREHIVRSISRGELIYRWAVNNAFSWLGEGGPGDRAAQKLIEKLGNL